MFVNPEHNQKVAKYSGLTLFRADIQVPGREPYVRVGTLNADPRCKRLRWRMGRHPKRFTVAAVCRRSAWLICVVLIARLRQDYPRPKTASFRQQQVEPPTDLFDEPGRNR